MQDLLVTQNSRLWHLPLSWPKADKQEITVLNFSDNEIQLLYTRKDTYMLRNETLQPFSITPQESQIV